MTRCKRSFVTPVAIPADYFDKHPSEAPPAWFVDVWSKFEAERAAEIPNRLHGAAINAEGCAI